MRGWSAVAVCLFAFLALSGCATKGSDGTTSSSRAPVTQTITRSHAAAPAAANTTTQAPETPATPPRNDTAPVASLNASVVKGGFPLKVNFTLGAADPDGDNVTYSFDADGLAPAEKTGSGRDLKVLTNFTYRAKGLYNATLTVSDGNLTTVQVLRINVTAAAASAAGPGSGPKTDYSCTVTIGGPTSTSGSSGTVSVTVGSCTFTTTTKPLLLAAMTPASGCTINAGSNAAVLNTVYPSATKFTMACSSPTTTSAVGKITLQS